MHYKILFVDDETANLRLLERLFRDDYEIYTAPGGAEALELLAQHDVALIISDQRMPGLSGCEFLKKAAEMRPQTVRIMLTGYTDVNDLVDAINSGVVYRYITKPWINEELQQTVKRALQHYETSKAQRQLQLQSERLQGRLGSAREAFVDFVVAFLDNFRPGASERAERVSRYAFVLGSSVGVERPELEQMAMAARIREITELAAAGRLLEKLPDLEEVAEVLRYQKEHFDGSGTPFGFAGDQIPLASRIIALAAAYDGLRNPPGATISLDHDEAIRMLSYDAGKRYDPGLLRSLSASAAVAEPQHEIEALLPV